MRSSHPQAFLSAEYEPRWGQGDIQTASGCAASVRVPLHDSDLSGSWDSLSKRTSMQRRLLTSCTSAAQVSLGKLVQSHLTAPEIIAQGANAT